MTSPDFTALDALADKCPADEQPSLAELRAHLELLADIAALPGRSSLSSSGICEAAGVPGVPSHPTKEAK